ncbi:MAG: hypothetical protein AAF206_14730 [Bacteroidota bacterium]
MEEFLPEIEFEVKVERKSMFWLYGGAIFTAGMIMLLWFAIRVSFE